jgi:DNA-binding transcriptional LysR family regulator
MLAKGLSLRGLEVFEALAETGSVAGAAARTGLSQPAVSQQMRNLETAAGAALVDHTRRPMQLTPAGRAYLRRARAALAELRAAQSELTVMDLAHLNELGLGVIDDFDNDLTPRLVTLLAQSMTRCRFRLMTAPSHEILAAMEDRRLQMGIVASDGTPVERLRSVPLVRDPFVFVCPAGQVAERGGIDAVMAALPLLRHDRAQLIGRMVEGYLQRRGLRFEHRFEIGPHLSLMTLVARGAGWTITTPLGYMRAARLHDRTEAHPLPFEGFARQITLFSGTDLPETVPVEVAATVRRLIDEMVVGPALQRLPWLEGVLQILPDRS